VARFTSINPVGRLAARLLVLAAVVAVSILPAFAAPAQGRRSLDAVKDRLDEIQAELDAATANVEELLTRENGLRLAVARVDDEVRDLELARARLQERAVAAAQRIYMASNSDTLEVLLSSESFSEIASRSQALAHISQQDASALLELKTAGARLEELQADLLEKADALTVTRARLAAISDELEAQFEAVTEEYNRLKARLAAAAARRAEALNGQVYIAANGMTCPIAAPTSFIDSWGFPRDGGARSHEGADMMAAKGAPVVAITDGRITYAGVGATAGNWIILTGDDGNEYYYMHNDKNIVTSGRVTVGEQIATVGDTGNAIGGPPHVHFEFHPGGGGPINPYPLLDKVCRVH
jgi:peptidoglycan LD-endopeptidase LytH